MTELEERLEQVRWKVMPAGPQRRENCGTLDVPCLLYTSVLHVLFGTPEQAGRHQTAALGISGIRVDDHRKRVHHVAVEQDRCV